MGIIKCCDKRIRWMKKKGRKNRGEVFIHKHNNRANISQNQALCLQLDIMEGVDISLHLNPIGIDQCEEEESAVDQGFPQKKRLL